MSDVNEWPMLLFLGIGIVLLSIPRMFSVLDTAPASNQHRLSAIDGLRGILASAVFFHHYFITTYPTRGGAAGLPQITFYDFLGPAAVSVFFMITGYLFWTKVLKLNGSVDWIELLSNRIFRIYPLYLALILYYFTYVVLHRDATLSQNAEDILTQVLSWLAFGAIDHPPPLLGQPQFLGLVGQTWSLSYEWAFYLSLPLLACIVRHRACFIILCCTIILAFLHRDFLPWPANDLTVNLLIGMAVAHLRFMRPLIKTQSAVFSMAVIVFLLLAITSFNEPYRFETSFFCGVIFYIIASGNTMFGCLVASGAERLGNISYSIYLIHGVIINAVSSIRFYHKYMFGGGVRYWLMFLITYLLVIGASILSFRLIEMSGISFGRKFNSWCRSFSPIKSFPRTQ